MKLTDWIQEERDESEILDVFFQIIRLLQDEGKGAGLISPAVYQVDGSNNVVFSGSESLDRAASDYRPPETGRNNVTEKGNVFSLGMLLYFLLHKMTFYQSKNVSADLLLKARRKSLDLSMIKAEDSSMTSSLIERMTIISPESRISLKEARNILNGCACRFSILFRSAETGEIFTEKSFSFAGSNEYKFVPDKTYVINNITLAPLKPSALIIPFRLVKKQYALDVIYAKEGRWSYAYKKPHISALAVPPQNGVMPDISVPAAALYFCDAVWGVKGLTLICGFNGDKYELYYADGTDIKFNRKGVIAAPERIESRILSLFKQAGKKPSDIGQIIITSGITPVLMKIINDLFPEESGIYNLSEEEDFYEKGAAVYASKTAETAKPQGWFYNGGVIADLGLTVRDPIADRYRFETLIQAGTPLNGAGGLTGRAILRPTSDEINNGACTIVLFSREQGYERVNSPLEPDGDRIRPVRRIKAPLPAEYDVTAESLELTVTVNDGGEISENICVIDTDGNVLTDKPLNRWIVT